MPRSCPAFLLTLLCWAACTACLSWAQGGGTLQGVVTDVETGAPLAGAHLFIATSTLGTTTDAEGRYRLAPLPLGAHRLVLSMVGYETETVDLIVRRPITHRLDFVLHPQVMALDEVTVTAERDRHWRRRLARFEQMLVGETPNAAQVRLLNPEVLDFRAEIGQLIATAQAPLELENRALGYRIRYHLQSFVSEGDLVRQDGEAFFEPLVPNGAEEAAQWAEARRRAFHGSPRHFLLSLLAGQTREDGFVVYTVRYPTSRAAATDANPRFIVDPSEFLQAGRGATERYLVFEDYLEIIYAGEREHPDYRRWQGLSRQGRPGPQRSWLHLPQGGATVDVYGSVLDPYTIAYYGYMSFERLADLLPKTYRPVLPAQNF